MAVAAPATVVQAPPATPPRVSLVTAGRDPRPPDERWTAGFSYGYVNCVPEPTIHDACAVGENRAVGTRTTAPPPTTPWVVEVADKCSAFGFDSGDYQARAAQLLDAATPWGIEHEFWRGDAAQADAWGNLYLADHGSPAFVDVGGAAVKLFDGLALLQEAIGNSRTRGMIHADVRTVSLWESFGFGLRREGQLLLDAFDNYIVPGGGYDGSGDQGAAAAAGHAWAYATGIVEVRRAAPQTTPATFGEALDRRNNTIVFAASRFVAATWDGCLHAGVLLDLTDRS